MRIIDKESTKGKIIRGLGIGLGITVALSNKRTSYKVTKEIAMKLFGKSAKPKNLTDSFSKLRRQKLISIERKGKEDILTLTENGRIILLRFNYEDINIKQPKIWDRLFRLVIFDIPEKNRKQRDMFRFKLKDLGFVKFNDSVWVYPYPCQKEIDFITNHLMIGKYVHFVLAKDITNRDKLERAFKL